MWTLGTLIAFPLFTVIGLVIIAFGLLIIATQEEKGDTWFGLGFVGGGLVVLIVTAIFMYPFKADYHKWNTKDGTVTSIEKRLVGSGDGMQEKFVVVIDGHDDPYGCLDTRCALLTEGDYLKLACKKVFEYGATDGWDCKFREWEDRADNATMP